MEFREESSMLECRRRRRRRSAGPRTTTTTSSTDTDDHDGDSSFPTGAGNLTGGERKFTLLIIAHMVQTSRRRLVNETESLRSSISAAHFREAEAAAGWTLAAT